MERTKGFTTELRKTLGKTLSKTLGTDLISTIEGKLDRNVEKVLSHPAFLTSVSVAVNFNSYRRKLIKSGLQRLIADLELPSRSDQVRMLALIERIEARMDETLDTRAVSEREMTAKPKKVYDVVEARRARL